MNNKKTEYTVQYLENLGADFSVDPPILRRGLVQKNSSGAYIDAQENYAIQVDEVSTADTMYVGLASIGAATNEDSWQICKIYSVSGAVVTWADGNDDFDNIWENRTSLTYS